MPDRYFSADAIEGPTALLEGGEAHHLLHVMRAAPGLKIVLFDGRGGEFSAEVVRCGRSEVELAVGSRHCVERELPYALTLAVPMPKGDRQRWLIEKAVELGVSRLVPLKTARTERSRGEAAAKLHRYVVEASKQCGRNRLMAITSTVEWSELLGESGTRRIIAHPGGQPCGQAMRDSPGDTIVAVGPEGGFTDHEVAVAEKAGWEIVDLGERILRVETAALTLIAMLSAG